MPLDIADLPYGELGRMKSIAEYQNNDPLKRLTAVLNKKSTQELINSFAFTYNNLDLIETEAITNSEAIDNFVKGTTTYTSNAQNQTTSSVSTFNSGSQGQTTISRTYVYDDDGNMTGGYSANG